MRIVLPDEVLRVLDCVERAGGRPLIVGGGVRDAALGLEPKDFDVEVFGLDVDALTRALAEVGKVNAVGKSFGVLKVAVGDAELDVSTPRRERKAGRGHRGFLVEPDPGMTLEQAASRRDFTINAMAYDPRSGKLIDPFGGLDDLRRRVLRHTGPAFVEDPLRVLRGVQLAGRFELDVSDDTVELSRSLLGEYDTLAPERIWGEWWKWAAKSTRPSRGLHYLERCGWIDVYPELGRLRACPQDPEWHPEGDVWTHTLYVVDAAAAVARRDDLPAIERGVLLLSALCHDLGKPATTFERDGRVRSPGHADRIEDFDAFLSRLGCPRRLRDRVVALCRFHLSHLDFADSARHVRRLARNLGDGGETIEMLARLVEADQNGRPPLEGGRPAAMTAMLELARELEHAAAAPKPLLSGRHLIEMGVSPGPEMGRILAAAFEAQLDGQVATLDQARDWVRERFLS